MHHAGSEPALDANLDGEDEFRCEFLVAGDASLESNFVAANAENEHLDPVGESTLVTEKDRGDAGVENERLDELLERLGDLHPSKY